MLRLAAVFAFGALLACAEERREPFTPYALGQALVIGPDKGGRHARLADACDDSSDPECRAALESCGNDAYADVVLDEDRDLLDLICYPGSARVRELGEAPVESAEAGNHTVLVLDDVADGADVTGDVRLTGNGAVVYGSGPELSVIGGDLAVDKNTATVRGVRVQGDVTVTKNNARFAFCEIDGDLSISGNNATVAECVVHGAVRIDGNNAVFVRNQLGTDTALSGKNLRCNANVALAEPGADAGPPPAAIPCSG